MTLAIDLNADVGESFGRWSLGNDREIFDIVTTVNIACGFHAGDPVTMRNALREARAANVSVGAHPGYPDLIGFGRRPFVMSTPETVDNALYQVGALKALAADEDIGLSHVKPHGALMAAVVRDPELALALGTALQSVQSGIPLVISPGPAFEALCKEGLPAVPESAADLEIDADGFNVIEPTPQTKDPDLVGKRAVQLAKGTVTATTGEEVSLQVQSICIHGDRPNAVDVAAAVRQSLEGAGMKVRSIYR